MIHNLCNNNSNVPGVVHMKQVYMQHLVHWYTWYKSHLNFNHEIISYVLQYVVYVFSVT